MNHSIYYMIDNRGKITATNDLMVWAKWMETPDGQKNKIVEQTKLDDVFVSTVFLGLDYSFAYRDDAPPVLFETMVFDNRLTYDEDFKRGYHKSFDGMQERYTTLEQAKKGHEETVDELRRGTRWTCSSCDKLRADNDISVYTVPIKDLPHGKRNYRYCTGDDECYKIAFEKGEKMNAEK